MKAPEKIYLRPLSDGETYNHWYRTDWENDCIEYTRTNAFIEKAEKYLNSKLYDWVRIEHPNPSVSPELIIKQDFIEGFKNYMKGE